jgi:hypothetical protein
MTPEEALAYLAARADEAVEFAQQRNEIPEVIRELRLRNAEAIEVLSP